MIFLLAEAISPQRLGFMPLAIRITNVNKPKMLI